MKNKTWMFAALLALGILAVSCSKDDPTLPPVLDQADSVAFNELLSTGNPDWIELYNYGERDVNLENWTIYDNPANAYTLPPGYTLEPGDFIILNCDDQGIGLNLPFRLSSQGESLTLLRPDGKIIDQVTFPALGDGQSYSRFPDGEGIWQITGFATKGLTNGERPVSAFKSMTYTPSIPLVGDDITFSLEISDPANVSGVQLIYRVDDEPSESVDMTTSDLLNYSATIPALTADGELYYYFKLTDSGGEEVFLPYDALTDPYDMTITSGSVPNLIINEFMASNSSTIADPDGVDEYDDWIEIYNAGSTPVDMGRFYFSDAEDPFDDRIPGDTPVETTIQPGGYLLFWADSDTEQGPNHLKFRLSIDGEVISLFYKDGRLIDSHAFGPQTADISEGRSPDGSDNWIKFNTPTPGDPNN